MPVAVIVHLRFRPGRAREGLAELTTILPDTRSFDGFTSVDVVRDQAEPDHVALLLRWQGRENHDNPVRATTRTDRGRTLIVRACSGAYRQHRTRSAGH